jgi:4'-phosphopantetheinyl transferase EntD
MTQADLDGLFDPRAVVVLSDPTIDRTDALFPDERPAIANAVPLRRLEYAAGRHCAHLAMARLGSVPRAVPAGLDRAPVWPGDLVGSITHTRTHCAAVLARRSDGIVSIGLDMEPAEGLPAELIETICGPEELAWLDRSAVGERLLRARLIYSAKEAFFKCQYGVSRAMIDFQAARVTFAAGGGSFVACFTRQVGPFAEGRALDGRFHVDEAVIATGVMLVTGITP